MWSLSALKHLIITHKVTVQLNLIPFSSFLSEWKYYINSLIQKYIIGFQAKLNIRLNINIMYTNTNYCGMTEAEEDKSLDANWIARYSHYSKTKRRGSLLYTTKKTIFKTKRIYAGFKNIKSRTNLLSFNKFKLNVYLNRRLWIYININIVSI